MQGHGGERVGSQSSVLQEQTRRNQDIVEKFNSDWNVSAKDAHGVDEDSLLMPCSVPLAILPIMISPLKGLKTIRRNLTGRSVKNSTSSLKLPTINVDKAGSMADQTV